jgi:hypothetical protein
MTLDMILAKENQMVVMLMNHNHQLVDFK